MVGGANLVVAVQGDEDHAPADDDRENGSSLELLTGGAAVEVAVFRPCVLGGFEIEEGGRVVAELAFVFAFVGVGDVGLEGEEDGAVEAIEILIGSFELIGVAGVEVDLGGVGQAGVSVGRGQGLHGVGNEDRTRRRWRRLRDRVGSGELSESERRAEQEQGCGQGAVSRHGVGPILL